MSHDNDDGEDDDDHDDVHRSPKVGTPPNLEGWSRSTWGATGRNPGAVGRRGRLLAKNQSHDRPRVTTKTIMILLLLIAIYINPEAS